MGDRGANFPALWRRDAQLSERHRRSRRVRVPAALRRRSKCRQRSVGMTNVERGVRLDELDRRAQVILFPDSLIVRTFASPRAAKVKAKNREACILERTRDSKNDFVVHRAAK